MPIVAKYSFIATLSLIYFLIQTLSIKKRRKAIEIKKFSREIDILKIICKKTEIWKLGEFVLSKRYIHKYTVIQFFETLK